jgi:hypothetical protein
MESKLARTRYGKKSVFCVHVEHFIFLSLIVQSHKSISKSCLKHPVHGTAKRSLSAKTASELCGLHASAFGGSTTGKERKKVAAVFKTGG